MASTSYHSSISHSWQDNIRRYTDVVLQEKLHQFTTSDTGSNGDIVLTWNEEWYVIVFDINCGSDHATKILTTFFLQIPSYFIILTISARESDSSIVWPFFFTILSWQFQLVGVNEQVSLIWEYWRPAVVATTNTNLERKKAGFHPKLMLLR